MDKEAKNDYSHGAIRRSFAGRMLGSEIFLAAVATLYLLGLMGQLLTARVVLARFGIWPFLLMQIVLIGVWYILHARRLRDAGRSMAPARGIAVIHILAIMLLVLVGAFYMEGASGDPWMPESLLLIQQLITVSRGGGDLLTILGFVACAALLVPPLFSLWAAAQPRWRA